MYILNFREYSMVDSPSLMQVEPPCLKVCFSRSGSSAGSKDCPTFSSRTGYPIWMQFSSDLRNSLSDCFRMLSLEFFSVVLIQRVAMSSGSMMSTHLLAVERIMALSVVKLSWRSPFACQV